MIGIAATRDPSQCALPALQVGQAGLLQPSAFGAALQGSSRASRPVHQDRDRVVLVAQRSSFYSARWLVDQTCTVHVNTH
jgi:hypothetical protein